MRLRAVQVCLVFLALIAPARHALGDGSEQVPVGPRAIGMGGAFSSLADDATALFWNPAGLPWIGHQEITGTHADLYGAGIKDNYLSFVLPLSLNHAVAVDWYHSGFTDPELDFGENRIDLAYGWRFRSLLSVGAGAKLLTRSTGLDGATVRRGSGVGMDLGLLATPAPGVRVGLVGQDMFDTRLRYDGGASVVAFPRNVRAAASYAFGHKATVALDLDDRVHLGLETTPLEGVALRAGLEDGRRDSEAPTWTVGAGFKASVLRADYAAVFHPVLPATHHFALSVAFQFNPAQIRIEKLDTREIYGSLYRSYADHPIGTARVRNLRDTPLSGRLSVFVPELMDAPSEQEILLRPLAVQDVPLTAVLSPRALAEPGDRTVQIHVSATYQSQRLPRTEKRSARLVAYGPGAIDWSGGVDQAAAFVTTRDPAVDALAREAARTVALMPSDLFANRNLGLAAAIFDALGELGVAYVPDPNNPFSAISETPRAVDTVHYPRETLTRRTGDCDDTSVLMAALLSNVGVNSQFVDVPGHLFLLVDTGLHERHRLALSIPDDLTVVHEDQVWIPLETTAIGKGFAEAWRIGAGAYAGWAARGQAQLVDVLDAQSRYESAELPNPGAGTVPPLPGLGERLARDAREVAGWREEYLATRFGGARQAGEPSAAALGEMAHIYYLAGRLDEARARLEQILAREPGALAARNNLGVVLAAGGETAGALDQLEAALADDAGDPGLWLNLGLARYAAGDTAGVEAPFARALELSGGYSSALGLLGLGDDASARGEPTTSVTAEEVRRLLKAAAQRIPDPAAPGSEKGPAARPLPSPQPPRMRVGATRSEWIAELKPLWYWKK